MSKTMYTCTGCIPIDKSIVDTYVALLNTEASVKNAEDSRQEAEGQGDYSDATQYPNTRRAKETARQAAEADRVKNEGSDGPDSEGYSTSRIKMEIDRQSAETQRQTNEGIGATDAECAAGSRRKNESIRQANEETRQSQEETRQAQEGTPSDEASASGSRWARYKYAEAARQTSYETDEGEASDAASATGSRWARYNKAEADREAAYDTAEASRTAGMAPLAGYYACGTAASTAAKEVAATNYVLTNGGSIKVKFTYANSASSPTLNINSTGAKAIVYNGAAASASNTWAAGDVVDFYYDPTYNSNAGAFVGIPTVASVSQNTLTTDNKAKAISVGGTDYNITDQDAQEKISQLGQNVVRFDISWVDNTFIDASNGGQYSHLLYDSTDYILVKGIKTLEINTCATADDSGYAFYTEDKTFISGGHFTSDSVPVINRINVPDTAVYFRYTFYKNIGYDKSVSYAEAINVLGCINNLALSNVVSKESPYTITKTSGYYISDTGVVIDNVDYFVTDAIEFHKGDVITLLSRDPSGDAVARMSKWEDNNFVRVISLGTTTYTKTVYIVTEDTEYIRFSGYLNTTSYPFDVYLKKLYIGESFTQAVSLIVNPISKNALISEDIVPTLTLVSGHYIAANGGIGESDYFYSESVAFKKGEVITLESRDPSGDAVARISKWTKDGVFVRAIALGTTSLTTVSYTVEDDVEYIRFSGYARVESYPFNLVTKQTIIPDTFKGAVIDIMSPYLPKNTKYWSYAMGNILCIGDSLTEGAYYVSGHAVGSGASIKQNYPYMLRRMLGAEVTNAGYSGISASVWYADHISGYDYMDYDSVIIWLGTNNGLTDTLDTDVEPYSDYHDYANTETGNYCKIIEAIKESNPDIKIFLTKIFASGGSVATTNVVIDKIAVKYGLFVIDNSDLSYANYPELHGNVTDNPHFSKAGNIFIANRFVEKIGKYLSEDPMLCEFGISAFVRG